MITPLSFRHFSRADYLEVWQATLLSRGELVCEKGWNSKDHRRENGKDPSSLMTPLSHWIAATKLQQQPKLLCE